MFNDDDDMELTENKQLEIEDYEAVYNTPQYEVEDERSATHYEILGAQGHYDHGIEILRTTRHMHGVTVLGAAPSKTKTGSKPAAKKAPLGNGASWSSIVRNSVQVHDRILKNLSQLAAKKPDKPKFRAVVHKASSTVLGSVLVGATDSKVSSKSLTPTQKKALDKYNSKVAESEKKAKKAADAIRQATASLGKLKSVAGKTARKAYVLKRLPPTRMKGFDYLGEEADPSADINNVLNDPELGAQSTPVPIDTAVRKVLDGIVYDGSKGWPRYAFGSYSYYFGPKDFPERPKNEQGQWGFVWGWNHGNWPNDNISPRWVLRRGRNWVGIENWDDYNFAAGDASQISSDSLAGKGQEGSTGGKGISNYGGPVYGPLISDPDSEFANLRWATEDKKWFWFPSEAPAWATQDIRNEQALAQSAADKANRDAAAAEQAAKDKEAADEAARQAKQAFEESLTQQAADAAAKVAATQQSTQQAQQDTDYTNQQRQLDLEAQRAQLEWFRKQMENPQAYASMPSSDPLSTTQSDDSFLFDDVTSPGADFNSMSMSENTEQANDMMESASEGDL